MIKPKSPAPLSIVVKYLAIFDDQSASHSSGKTRANDLLTRILGNDAGFAIPIPDDYEIRFKLDDMQLRFIEGATAEDDHYRVSFLNIPTFVGVRTPDGLGYALTTILERLRIKNKCDHLEHLRTKGENAPDVLS